MAARAPHPPPRRHGRADQGPGQPRPGRPPPPHDPPPPPPPHPAPGGAPRAARPAPRLVVAFQPHLYSRTQEFAEGFGQALGLADEVVVMDVYGAREDPVPGVTGAMVADAVPLPRERVLFEPSWSAAAPALAARARPGDLVMTMGAGDVSMVGPEVLAVLRAAGGGDPAGADR
ncbi:glutamate ligase domain-containing protein [Blastococcus deserti]